MFVISAGLHHKASFWRDLIWVLARLSSLAGAQRTNLAKLVKAGLSQSQFVQSIWAFIQSLKLEGPFGKCCAAEHAALSLSPHYRIYKS